MSVSYVDEFDLIPFPLTIYTRELPSGLRDVYFNLDEETPSNLAAFGKCVDIHGVARVGARLKLLEPAFGVRDGEGSAQGTKLDFLKSYAHYRMSALLTRQAGFTKLAEHLQREADNTYKRLSWTRRWRWRVKEEALIAEDIARGDAPRVRTSPYSVDSMWLSHVQPSHAVVSMDDYGLATRPSGY